MNTSRGVNLAACAGKARLISLCALSLSAWLVLSRYHTVPVPLVSTSPQKGAMSWAVAVVTSISLLLTRGNGTGVKADTG